MGHKYICLPFASEAEDKNFKRHFRLAAPASGRYSRAAMAAPPARGGSMPQSMAARRGTAMRRLDRRLRRRDAEGPGVFRGEGLGAGRREKLGGVSRRCVASGRDDHADVSMAGAQASWTPA
jgi:hypothetical protein